MELIENIAEQIIKMHLELSLTLKSSLSKAIEIGEKLAGVKEEMDHGTFTPWIEANMPFSVRTAQNYLKLFINKDKLLAADIDDLSGAYLLLAPKEDESDVHIHENPSAKDQEYQNTQFSYWEHLGPLIEKMDKVFERLSGTRDSTTPVGLGNMIGNIKDMSNVLKTWEPGEMDECSVCGGSGCDLCINGKSGRSNETSN